MPCRGRYNNESNFQFEHMHALPFLDNHSCGYQYKQNVSCEHVKGKEPTAENPVSQKIIQINKDKERSGELDLSRDM